MVVTLILMCQGSRTPPSIQTAKPRVIYVKKVCGMRKKIVAKVRVALTQIKDSMGNIHSLRFIAFLFFINKIMMYF